MRRGMARDIVDAGGSLATLLRAGEWRSAAFIAYLRETQAQDNVIANLMIDHSDSESVFRLNNTNTTKNLQQITKSHAQLKVV